MTLARVNVTWQNWPGAPGVSTFYLDPAPSQSSIDAIRAFFNAFVGFLPSGLTINVPNSGDEISEATGNLSGVWSTATPPLSVVGSGTAAYAGNAGAVVHWLTASMNGTRRVRGRTYMVPLTSNAYETNGSLTNSFITAATNAATTLMNATPGVLNVWSRPRPGGSGLQASVTGVRVPDLAVTLRSRRV